MNPRKTTILTVILSVFLVMILLTVPAGADTVIIHTNDVHGQLTDNIGYDGVLRPILRNVPQQEMKLFCSMQEMLFMVRLK